MTLLRVNMSLLRKAFTKKLHIMFIFNDFFLVSWCFSVIDLESQVAGIRDLVWKALFIYIVAYHVFILCTYFIVYRRRQPLFWDTISLTKIQSGPWSLWDKPENIMGHCNLWIYILEGFSILNCFIPYCTEMN